MGDQFEIDLDDGIASAHAGLQQAFDIAFQLGASIGRILAPTLGVVGRNHLARAPIDHRHIAGRQAGDGRGDEVAHGLRVGRRQFPGRTDRGHRSGARGGRSEWLIGRIGNMHTGRSDVGAGLNGAGQFALFRAPIGGIEHLAGGTETGQFVQKLIPLPRQHRQAF